MWIESSFQFDHQFEAVGSVGEVNHIGDSKQFFVVDTVFDFLDDFLWANQVGELSNHKAELSRADTLDAYLGPRLERTSSAFIGVFDSFEANNDSAGWKIWAWNKAHEVFCICSWVGQ